MTDGDGDSEGLFGRPASSLPAGGSAWRDFRRALAYPRTMSLRTFLAGGAVFFGSLFVLPIPLLYGYVSRVADAVGRGEPAPGFENWERCYLRGLGLFAVSLVVLLAPLFGIALVVAVLGQTENEALSDLVGGLVLLWWLYALPWTIGVYGTGSWRSLADALAWRWAVSVNYVVAYVLAAATLFVGYFAFALSLFTIVGWVFVGFYLSVVLGALAGGRYHSYRAGRSDAAAPSAALDPAGLIERVRDALPSGTPSGASTAATGSGVGSETGSGRSAGSAGGGGDPEPRESAGPDYELLRERARTVRRDGPIERLESGDDGRVGYLSLAEGDDGTESRTAFERAVDRWEGISHNPGVATVHDTGSGPTPWVAFETLDGPLAAVAGELSDAEVVAVTESVADAITTGRMYNIAHGELSPRCVYVERAGGTASADERITAAVGDWGISGAVRELTGEDGRPTRYLAPEQIDGGGADRRVDVYQLAAIAHCALLGEPPYAAIDDRPTSTDSDASWRPPEDATLPEAAVEAFERALAPDPAKRHGGTNEFVAALRGALG